MNRVINIRKEHNENAVYIGRGSKWGNPYRIDVHGTRNEVIRMYEEHLMTSPELLKDLHELKGRDLACFCAPKACHGDLLLKMANRPTFQCMPIWD